MSKPKIEYTDDELYKLYIEHGKNASSLAKHLHCHPSNARKRIVGILSRLGQHAILEQLDPKFVNTVAELLKKQNIDPNTIRRLRDVRINAHTMGIKNAEGQFEEHGLSSITAKIDPILTAENNPCLTQAPPITVLYTPSDAPRILRKVSVTTVISDTQIGFMQGPNGLETIHDLEAIDVMQQIVAAERPSLNVWIGDVADLTQFSRWPQRKEFSGCAQISINETSRILAETHSALGPQCKLDIVIGGNHDARLQLYADANAREFSGLKRADALPEEWPVNSLPFLCRFDEIGIKFSGEYPGGTFWVYDNLCFMHAPPKKLEMRASVIHGHTHHLTMTTTAQHNRHGRENFFLVDVGCLCKVGSRTDPKSVVALETPSDRARSDWAQGMGVIYTIEGKIPKHQFSLMHIDNGSAIHNGQLFQARTLKGGAA